MAHSSPDRAAKTGKVVRGWRRVDDGGGMSESGPEIGRNEGVGEGRLGVNPAFVYVNPKNFYKFVRSSFKSLKVKNQKNMEHP